MSAVKILDRNIVCQCLEVKLVHTEQWLPAFTFYLLLKQLSVLNYLLQ